MILKILLNIIQTNFHCDEKFLISPSVAIYPRATAQRQPSVSTTFWMDVMWISYVCSN